MDDGEYIDDRVEEGMKGVSSDEWEDMDDDGGEQMMAVDNSAGKEKKKTKKVEVNIQENQIKEEDMEKQSTVWDEEKQPLQEDEELDFDSSAYQMLHRSEVEWPCLSIDVLVRSRCAEAGQPTSYKDWFGKSSLNQLSEENSHMNETLGIREHNDDKYPMNVYFCGGSQCVNKSENKIYVMKWSEMVKTLHDDDVPEDNSEDDE